MIISNDMLFFHHPAPQLGGFCSPSLVILSVLVDPKTVLDNVKNTTKITISVYIWLYEKIKWLIGNQISLIVIAWQPKYHRFYALLKTLSGGYPPPARPLNRKSIKFFPGKTLAKGAKKCFALNKIKMDQKTLKCTKGKKG